MKAAALESQGLAALPFALRAPFAPVRGGGGVFCLSFGLCFIQTGRYVFVPVFGAAEKVVSMWSVWVSLGP